MGTSYVKSGSRLLLILGGILLALQIVTILFLTGIIKLDMALVNCASTDTQSNIKLTSDVYGTMLDGTKILRYKIQNSKGTRVEVITLGGIMTELWVPDKFGNFKDILLSYKDLSTLEKGMTKPGYPYFGALVGRVAGRISGASFALGGTRYNLTDNNQGSTIHGGTTGWSMKVWNAATEGNKLKLSLTSPDGDNGFPGRVEVSATYSLSEDDALTIEWTAQAFGSDTPINPTSHGYFNLAGEGTGDIYKQKVEIFADEYAPTDSLFMPYGNFSSVAETGYDLRNKTDWGSAIDKVISPKGVKGLVACYKLRGPEGLRYAARIEDLNSGRIMKVYTDQLGLQIYTSDYVNVPTGEGKNGHNYPQHSGFCMETQNFPDAINKDVFPDSVLRQGATYKHTVKYIFSIV